MKNISSVIKRNATIGFFTILIFSCISKSELYAQRKFTNGFIVTILGDTIHGLVKDEEWVMSPEQIEFKQTGSPSKTYLASSLKVFQINNKKSIYRSEKIGVLDMVLTREYTQTPSLVAKDSAQLFLKELVTGKNASLYEYLDNLERPHYFLEQNGVITELINYPYYLVVNNKKYLLSIEKYREQLKEMAANSPLFKDSLLFYQEKYLKRYIKRYNESFPDHGEIYESPKDVIGFDLDVNFGLESWNERPVILKRAFTFGLGGRFHFPGKFHNRFVKVNFFLTPNVGIGYDPTFQKIATLKTYEVAVGSYFGKSQLRPYMGIVHSQLGGGYRSDFLGLQAGLGLNRRFNLEIGHFANFACVFYETAFWTPPRISLHFMIPLFGYRN